VATGTRLERLAAEVPLPPDELRALLRRLIAQAQARLVADAPVRPTVALVCSVCSAHYLLSESRAQAVTHNGHRPVCPSCRYPRRGGEPGPREWRWVAALPVETYVRAVAAAGKLR
jgi:hypothetical protein